MENLVGRVFGCLTVLANASSIKNHGLWLCQCKCDEYRVARSAVLLNGEVNFCAQCEKVCARIPLSKTKVKNLVVEVKEKPILNSINKNNKTPKNSGHPLYGIYSGIKRRCHHRGSHAWEYYGAVGIFMCESWRNSFDQFLKDVGERPSSSHSLERINGKLGYSPDNVEWATVKTQARNKKKFKTNSSGKTGVFFEKRRQTWVSEATHPLTGKRVAKGFSIKKLGFMPAYNAACIHRDELIKSFNAIGAGYSKTHGL